MWVLWLLRMGVMGVRMDTIKMIMGVGMVLRGWWGLGCWDAEAHISRVVLLGAD